MESLLGITRMAMLKIIGNYKDGKLHEKSTWYYENSNVQEV